MRAIKKLYRRVTVALINHSTAMMLKKVPKTEDLDLLEQGVNNVAELYGEQDPVVASMRQHIRIARTMQELQKTTSGLLQAFEVTQVGLEDFKNPEGDKPIIH